MDKSDLNRINEYLWEVPKSYRKKMNVPVRIYASEKLLKDIFDDKSLPQLINVASLPGIVKYALGMPDVHQGFGAPIGGVGATKYPDGLISPSFIGFDENCTSGDSKVLLENGAYLSIQKLKENSNHKVKSTDLKDGTLSNVIPFNFFEEYNNPTINQVTTGAGNKIKATDEHPIQTKQGMKNLDDLEEGDSVLVHPFSGIEYEKPSSEVILNEKDLKKTLKKIGRKNSQGHAISQILNQLNKRDLLPVKYDSPFLPSLLRLMGFIFGDGVLSLGEKNKNPQLQFYAEPQDLKEIQKDIKKLGFKPSKIYSRDRKHSVTNTYGDTYDFSSTEHRVQSGARELVYFLIALGTPHGIKTHTSYRIPEWIAKAPLWQKRLFLAAFFGAELSAPSTQNKYNFHAPQLSMNKAKDLKENGKSFLKDIRDILDDFEVSSSVKRVPGNDYEGDRGPTVGLRLEIAENAENTVNLWQKVGYEYNKKKQKEACWAVNFLRKKLRVVEHRTKVRKKVREEYKEGKSSQELKDKYGSEYTPAQFIDHSLFSESQWKPGQKRGKPRIALDFPSFEEYKQKYPYKDQGLVWDKVEKIDEISYEGKVYDFTVNYPDHNFIADNFVVSNCGVRLLKSSYSAEGIKDEVDDLATEMQRRVPSGVGTGRDLEFGEKELDKILERGVQRLAEKGYAREADVKNCESEGRMKQADAKAVSNRAKNRGKDQLGTLGSGNHFLEVQEVDQIFDQDAAETFNLSEGQAVIMIHTGSRGFGHQVCTDYVETAKKAMSKYDIKVPDKNLASVPLSSSEGRRFFKAMSCGANYAWSNRQMITHFVRKAWKSVLGKENLNLLYDVAHNIAKVEKHEVDNEEQKLIVHRKGATRAFPPGHPEVPEQYREQGQPTLLPGSMGTSSYICVGTEQSKETFHSVNHGAGRTMSRHAATDKFPGQRVVKKLEDRGITVKYKNYKGIAEEASGAYKDINEVVKVVSQAGLSDKVARLKPLAVIKGE